MSFRDFVYRFGVVIVLMLIKPGIGLVVWIISKLSHKEVPLEKQCQEEIKGVMRHEDW